MALLPNVHVSCCLPFRVFPGIFPKYFIRHFKMLFLVMGFSFVSEVICKIYLRVAWGSFLWILKDVHVT